MLPFHLIFFEELLVLNLLMEGIDFDLIDRRSDLVMDHQIHDAVRMKIGYPDRPHFPLRIQFFHRAPFPIHIAIRLMDQEQVHIVQLQPLQAAIKGFLACLHSRCSGSRVWW